MPDVIIPVQQSIDQNPADDALVCFVIGPQTIGTRRWDAILAQMVALVGDGLPDIPEDGRNYTLRGRDNIGEGGQNEPITFWAIPFEVPSTPGEASGIGHVLTVFGEGDRDYRWAAQNAEAALPAIPEDGFDYTLRGRDRIGQGGSNEPIKFWARAREVPTTPGTQSGIGRILTVYGTNDRDYRWEDLNITAAVDAAVDAYLQANPPTAGVDAEARRLANAAGVAAMEAGTAAAAAQLDTDTVIEVGPDFVHNEDGPKVLGISIRHPVNAYAGANLMAVSAAGQPVVYVEYNPNQLHETTLAGVSAISLRNIWNVTHEIPDGQGGTRRIQTYGIGSYIPVEVRLTAGRGGTVYFQRTIDVLVIAPEAVGGDVDQTARDAAAAARAVANANAASLIPPSDAEAETATATNVRGWSAAKLRRLVEAIVPAWARAADAPAASVAGATIGSALGNGSRTLRNNQRLVLAENVATTIIMRNSRVLPAGASYSNNNGQLTLEVGRWQLTASAEFGDTTTVTRFIYCALRIVADVEGPTAAVVLAAQSFIYVPSISGIQAASVTALVQVEDLGSGNDTAVITLQGHRFSGATSNRNFGIEAARLDVVKLG